MRKYLNVTRVTIRGQQYYRARLNFPANDKNVRPRPKDFYARSAREADAKRSEYRERDGWQQKPLDSKITVAELLRDHFIPYQEARASQGDLSATRLEHRRSRLRRYVLEAEWAEDLADTRLERLSIAAVEEFFHNLTKRASSAETYNLVRCDLILAFKMAKRHLPRHRTAYFEDVPQLRVVRKAKKVFDVALILGKIWDDRIPLFSRLPVAFEFVMNCRPSEMFALRWADVDLRNHSVKLHAAMVWNKKEKPEDSSYRIREHGKGGEKSDRTLPMPAELTAMLRALQKNQRSVGPASEFVFCRENGKPYDKDTFDAFWKQIKRDLALPDGPTFYSLKTLGNSWARSQGVSGHAQARKMGHTTSRMSDTAYRELLDPELVAAVEIYGTNRPQPRKKASKIR
jgi:integrase